MDNLNDMSLAGLKDLRKKVDRAIANYEARTRQAALDAIEEAARGYGFKLADLMETQKSGRKTAASRPSDIRYVNPENAAETWSGRGRRPLWLVTALDAGRSMKDFLPQASDRQGLS